MSEQHATKVHYSPHVCGLSSHDVETIVGRGNWPEWRWCQVREGKFTHREEQVTCKNCLRELAKREKCGTGAVADWSVLRRIFTDCCEKKGAANPLPIPVRNGAALKDVGIALISFTMFGQGRFFAKDLSRLQDAINRLDRKDRQDLQKRISDLLRTVRSHQRSLKQIEENTEFFLARSNSRLAQLAKRQARARQASGANARRAGVAR